MRENGSERGFERCERILVVSCVIGWRLLFSIFGQAAFPYLYVRDDDDVTLSLEWEN